MDINLIVELFVMTSSESFKRIEFRQIKNQKTFQNLMAQFFLVSYKEKFSLSYDDVEFIY